MLQVDDRVCPDRLDAEAQPLLPLQLQHRRATLAVDSPADHGQQTGWVASGLHLVKAFRDGARGDHEFLGIRNDFRHSRADGAVLVLIGDDLDPAFLQARQDLLSEVLPQVGVEFDGNVRQGELVVGVVPPRHVVDHRRLDDE